MIRRMTLSLAVLSLVVLTGCPYSSKVPLAEPDGKATDDHLIGNWFGIERGGDTLQIVILPFNQSEYYAELHEKSGAPTGYRVFPFDVGGERFLHINELAPVRSALEYSFARYTFSGESELTLRFVGDKAVPTVLANDRRALLSFLKAHLADPSLNDDESALALHRSQ
jgi:hypothetical protein